MSERETMKSIVDGLFGDGYLEHCETNRAWEEYCKALGKEPATTSNNGFDKFMDDVWPVFQKLREL